MANSVPTFKELSGIEALIARVKAGDLDVVKKCVEGDAKLVNAKEDSTGRTALHYASELGHVFIIYHLAGVGAELNILDNEGMSPLMLACKASQLNAASALAGLKADVDQAGSTGASALHYAAAAGNLEILELLVSFKATIGSGGDAGPAIHWAIGAGDFAAVAFFVDTCQVSIAETDSIGHTNLHVAVRNGNADLTLFLLERGADPNIAAKDGTTALMLAAIGDKLEIVKHLLTFGADAVKEGDSKFSSAVSKELQKKKAGGYDLTFEKREQNMEKFKAQGNKVFKAGECSKSSKFYTLAISFSPNNHVLYSNRSASYYNLRRLHLALADATHCIALKPDWPKGYYRKGATLILMQKFEEAKAVFNAGFKFDPKNADLKNGMKELEKAMPKASK